MFLQSVLFASLGTALVSGFQNEVCDTGMCRNERHLVPRANCTVYTVVSGDTCDAIAKSKGITTAQLTSFNPGLNCGGLQIGQRLCVSSGTLPPSTNPNGDGSCQAYMVVSGDTCSAIATKFSITVAQIEQWNAAAKTYKWTSCSALQVGYNICVSSGTAPPVPVNPSLQCGIESPGNASCPLHACCSAFGFCGLTSEFCTTTGANPCQRDCFIPTLPSCSASSTARKMGYYAGWGNRRPCGAVSPNQIDLTGLTHVNFAFAVISQQMQIALSTNDDDPLLKALVARKSENSNLKVLIALGGWDFSESDPTKDLFTVMISTSANRAKFIASVKTFLSTYQLDGIDIDFEYPGAIERNAPATDTPNLTAFFQELRSSLGSGPIISVATPAGYWFLKGFEIDKIQNSVTFINMMSYDYHGQWDTNVTGQAPVTNPHTSILDMKDSASLYVRAGIDLSKVNLGLAWYARTYHLAVSSCKGYNCTMTGGGAAGNCSTTSGYLTQFETLDRLGTDKATLDTASQTYWFDKNGDLVTFDQDDTWNAKKTFAAQTCFGGTFVWSLDQVKPTTTTGPPQTPCKNAQGLAKKYGDNLMEGFQAFGRDPSTGEETGCGCFFKLQDYYQEALSIEAMINYAWATGDTTNVDQLINFDFSLDTSNGGGVPGIGTFKDGHDDAMWWVLVFLKLTQYQKGSEKTWIEVSKILIDWVAEDREGGNCPDGVWWKNTPGYKNTITNGLFIYGCATYYMITGDKTYLDNAISVWNWATRVGLKGDNKLYNDGANDQCSNNEQTEWTYNSGVFLAAAGALYQATGSTNSSYISWANETLAAVAFGPDLSLNGILQESCDAAGKCDHDQLSFKGAFMQFTQYFLDAANDAALTRIYAPWIGKQINAIHNNAEGDDGEVGSYWAAKSPQTYGTQVQFMALAGANLAMKYGASTGSDSC